MIHQGWQLYYEDIDLNRSVSCKLLRNLLLFLSSKFTQTINRTIVPTIAPTLIMEPSPTSITVHPIISTVPTNQTDRTATKATSTIMILLVISTVSQRTKAVGSYVLYYGG